MKKVSIAVIGVGHLGEYHVQKYRALPEVDLIGVVDTNAERAAEIARRYDTKAFGTHKEVLGSADAVSLAVPTEKHYEVAKDILSGGVHLLVEKPITYTLEPADTLISMAREKNLVLQVGLVERFNPAVVKMKSLLTRPVFVESHRMNTFTSRGTDVDVVLDLMIHDLDIILHVMPAELKEVHAVGMSVLTDKTDIANVRLIFKDGSVGNLTASRVSEKILRKIRVFQPDAYLSVNCYKREISVTRLAADKTGVHGFPELDSAIQTFPGSDPLADQIASFVHCVRNGCEPVVPGRDGRRALQVALGIIEQIKQGSKIFQAAR
jgi:predicted dehydrogenase